MCTFTCCLKRCRFLIFSNSGLSNKIRRNHFRKHNFPFFFLIKHGKSRSLFENSQVIIEKHKCWHCLPVGKVFICQLMPDNQWFGLNSSEIGYMAIEWQIAADWNNRLQSDGREKWSPILGDGVVHFPVTNLQDMCISYHSKSYLISRHVRSEICTLLLNLWIRQNSSIILTFLTES